jgi:hypothetical protein
MWPYTDDEAGWLTPTDQPERATRSSANDNDPAKRIPSRPALVAPACARKSEDET